MPTLSSLPTRLVVNIMASADFHEEDIDLDEFEKEFDHQEGGTHEDDVAESGKELVYPTHSSSLCHV